MADFDREMERRMSQEAVTIHTALRTDKDAPTYQPLQEGCSLFPGLHDDGKEIGARYDCHQ